MMPGDHHPPPTSIRQPFSSLAPAQHMQSHREQHRCRQVLLSVTVVVCVAITWALHTQFAQIALHINKEKFNAPYVLMWFNTCFMIFCYPIYLLVNLIRGEKIGETHQHASLLFGDRGFCLMSVLCKVTPFLLFWIAANYTYAKALVHVSASIATSISACNAAEVYILSIWILHDKFVPFKLLSVVFAIAGVAVISLGVYGAANLQWLGILLSILSATSAAFYKVLFKRVVGNADLSQVSLMMTCLGLLNLTLNFPPAIILPLTGVELFSWNGIPWIPLIGAGCLSLLFNFSINFGIAMLHPLVISVGMLIGIPLNASIDILFRSVPITASFVGGTVLICISFILIIFPYEMFRNGTKSIPAEESLPRAESI